LNPLDPSNWLPDGTFLGDLPPTQAGAVQTGAKDPWNPSPLLYYQNSRGVAPPMEGGARAQVVPSLMLGERARQLAALNAIAERMKAQGLSTPLTSPSRSPEEQMQQAAQALQAMQPQAAEPYVSPQRQAAGAPSPSLPIQYASEPSPLTYSLPAGITPPASEWNSKAQANRSLELRTRPGTVYDSARKTTGPITWDVACAIEPALLALEQTAQRLRFSWRNYERVKAVLKRLVGWGAVKPELQTSEAYDVAHKVVLAALEAKPGRESGPGRADRRRKQEEL
jgi:hypothetical protein